MCWNAVWNSKKPRAALIKGKKATKKRREGKVKRRKKKEEQRKRGMGMRLREQRGNRKRTVERIRRRSLVIRAMVVFLQRGGPREAFINWNGAAANSWRNVEERKVCDSRGWKRRRQRWRSWTHRVYDTHNCKLCALFHPNRVVQHFMIVLAIFALNRPINTRSTRQ